MDTIKDLFSEIPTDELKPDYDNRDPLRNVRVGAPRMHSRFPVVPTIGQGDLAIDKLVPVDIPQNMIEGLAEHQQASFRATMAEIVGDDIITK